MHYIYVTYTYIYIFHLYRRSRGLLQGTSLWLLRSSRSCGRIDWPVMKTAKVKRK